MRWLVLVATLALVGSGTALAAKGDPQRRIVAADQKLAKSLLVTRADLGQGWTATRSGSNDPDVECKGYDVDESDLVLTGEAESPELTFQNQAGGLFVSVGATASVFRTKRQALASWTRGVKDGLAQCLAHVMEVQAKREGTKLEIRPTRRATLPAFAPRQMAYRFVGTLTSGSAKVPMYVDIVFMARGRALTSILVASAVNPVGGDELSALMGIAGGRLAKADPKPPSGPTA